MPRRYEALFPEGTVLAPLLFLILVSDIHVYTNHTFMPFTNYSRISTEISSVEDTKLQTHINQVFRWATDNDMFFIEDKYQLLCDAG